MKRTVFVTATDTGAGKTWVTAHLIKHLLAKGERALALKPIASGVTDSGLNEDVEVLLQAQPQCTKEDINFHTFKKPLAPELAARHEGAALNMQDLLTWQKTQQSHAEITLVEGVGGLMVPLATDEEQSWLVSDWLQAMGDVEVMLVVPLRLGCMNQLLTSCVTLASMQQVPRWIVLNDKEKNDTAAETKQLVLPYLQRIFGEVPEVLCIKCAKDLEDLL